MRAIPFLPVAVSDRVLQAFGEPTDVVTRLARWY